MKYASYCLVLLCGIIIGSWVQKQYFTDLRPLKVNAMFAPPALLYGAKPGSAVTIIGCDVGPDGYQVRYFVNGEEYGVKP